MKYGYNYTIRRKDFKEVVIKRITYIDSLNNNVLAKKRKGSKAKKQQFRIDKSMR